MSEAQLTALSQPLDYTVILAKAALAEMRALIFELRPESLAVEGLIPTLTRCIDALCTRHNITVEATLPNEPVQEPLYSSETLAMDERAGS